MSSRAPRPDPLMHPEAMWAAADIARYSGFGQTVVETQFLTDPDFPRPVHPTGPDGHPRWFAGEVWAYFRGKRGVRVA